MLLCDLFPIGPFDSPIDAKPDIVTTSFAGAAHNETVPAAAGNRRTPDTRTTGRNLCAHGVAGSIRRDRREPKPERAVDDLNVVIDLKCVAGISPEVSR